MKGVQVGVTQHAKNLATLPTEQLLRAYQTQNDAFHLGNRAAPENNVLIKQILDQRGVDTGSIQVAPSGKVNKPGLAGIGQKIGGVLKTVAPIAALAIPGLGPVAAGALAAGGRFAGDVLQGRNALKGIPGDIASGALVGGGRFALGKIGGLLKGGGGAAQAGAAGAPAGGTAPAPGGGLGGTLQGIGQGLGVLNPGGGINPLGLARLGLGVAGTIQGAQAQGNANQALGRAVAPINVPMPNLSSIFADPNNPYQQQGPNTAQLAAVRALQAR